MIKIVVRVGEEGAGEEVFADSILEALGIVQARHPESELRVVHPIDPESFFVGNPASAARLELEEPVERPADRAGAGCERGVGHLTERYGQRVTAHRREMRSAGQAAATHEDRSLAAE